MNPISLNIVVSTYNHAPFIAQCLDSILMQKTLFPYKIILGEDASEDGTREICMEYKNKYPEKIRLFLRDRKDVIYINDKPTGRNNFIENLKACDAKYIALLDGDDYWTDPLKLQKQVDFLEKNPSYSSCFHNVYRALSTNHYDISDKVIYKNCQQDKLTVEDLLFNKYSLFHTSSFLFKFEHLIIPEWFKTVASGDMALFYLIADKGPIGRLKDVMSVYREHLGGVSKTDAHNQKGIAQSRIQMLELLNEHFNLKYDKIIQNTIEAFRTGKPVKSSNTLASRIFNKLKK